MRQASSEGGSKIIKGSASGAARAYEIRSPFLMSSIGVGIKQAADASRVSVLSLVKRKDTAIFARIKKLETSLLTTEYCKRFIARSIHRIPEIRENFLTFSHSDEDGLLSYLLAQVVEVEGRVWRGKRSVGELVSVALGTGAMDSFTASDAADVLGRLGMRVESAVLGSGRLTVSNTHPGIGKLLAGTAWGNGWMRILGRIDGARREEAGRFGPSHRSRGVSVPILE
jgi:hypothetical protein